MIGLLLTLHSAAAADFQSADQVLDTFKAEPDVRRVQDMAIEYSKTDPHYVEKWLAAAQNAAWLPDVTLYYEYRDTDGFDYDYEDDGSGDPVETLDGRGIDLYRKTYVKGTWELNKLVMSSEKIRTISEAQDIVKLRDKVLEDVTRLYFERRRLQVDMVLQPGDMKGQLKNELRLQELTAQIDAYTGGRYSQALKTK
jgi:hypothetical protein